MNPEGAKNVALVAKAIGARLVHVSTDYVFDGQKAHPYNEDDPPGAVSVYGLSKLEGERHIRQTWDRHFIFRTAWLYGAHGKNFVHTMLRLFQERDSVSVVDDQWGSATYAKDLAGVIVRTVGNDRQEFGTYHYTNEGRTTWYRFAQEIYRVGRKLGLCSTPVRIEPVTTADYPTAARQPERSYLSKEKIKRVLGEEIRGWRDALREFLETLGGS